MRKAKLPKSVRTIDDVLDYMDNRTDEGISRIVQELITHQGKINNCVLVWQGHDGTIRPIYYTDKLADAILLLEIAKQGVLNQMPQIDSEAD